MANHANLNVRLIELQTMPFDQVLRLIVDLPEPFFWRIIRWLAEESPSGEPT